MAPRVELVHRLAALAGGDLVVQEEGNGWPSLAEVVSEPRRFPVSLFVSSIGLSHRERDEVERRFQNPASSAPLVEQPGRTSLLLGVWEDDPYVPPRSPVFALAHARRRAGRITRWSVFVNLQALIEAEETGWSTRITDSGERIIYFRPELMTVALEAHHAQVDMDDRLVQRTVAATEFIEESGSGSESPGSRGRLRRAVSILVRDARFRGKVLEAYGRKCAMCDLGLSLVEAAHIYPASAVDSNDSLLNGIALCPNHHLAFDRHHIAILPENLEIAFHPDVHIQANSDAAVHRFIKQTRRFLRRPDPLGGPSYDMLCQRHSYFAGRYDWLGES